MQASRKKKWIIGIIIVLLLIQFIRIDKTNPPIDTSLDFIEQVKPNATIAAQIKNACYDCHSHERAYPWYTNVAPVSWWIKGHINNGTEQLNFSKWAEYSPKKANHKLEECVEHLERGSMPLKSYVFMHQKAKMTEAERTALIQFFKDLGG